MTINETDIQNIIRKITQDVLKSLGAEPEEKAGTLAVFSGYVFDAWGTEKYLKELKTEVTCVLLDNAEFQAEGFQCQRIETAEKKRRLAASLQSYTNIVLVTPPLSLIQSIALGDDDDYAATLCLRPLLWGRDVTLLLDFEAPGFKRGTAFEKLSDALNALESMGMKIETKAQKKQVIEEARDLVTEQDIKEAHKNETMRVKTSKGAIVTQLAEDMAKELGVLIER